MTDKKSAKRGAIERLRELEAYRITNETIVEALLSPEMHRSFDDQSWGIDEWNERVVGYIIDLLLDDDIQPTPAVYDMDGVEVNIGDVMCDPVAGFEFEVFAFLVTDHGTYVADEDIELILSVGSVRHKGMTVEDMLRDFAYCLEDGATEQSMDELVGEYAKKLQLKEGDDGC